MDYYGDDFRDPFVWKNGNIWYMIVGTSIRDIGGAVLLFKSEDLVNWQYMRPFMIGDINDSGYFWEMPIFVNYGDKYLFGVSELPPRNSYWTGQWKDEYFLPDSGKPKKLEIINHFLSPTVARDDKGRLIAIGIIPEIRSSSDQLQAGWSNVLSLPREYTLLEDGTLAQKPVCEIKQLRNNHRQYNDITITGKQYLPQNTAGNSLEVQFEVDLSKCRDLKIYIGMSDDKKERTIIGYDVIKEQFYIDRRYSNLDRTYYKDNQRIDTGYYKLPADKLITLDLFIDHSVIEVFVNGTGSFSTRTYPSKPDNNFNISCDGTVLINKLDVWEMASIWE